jgi:hypothetical protein
VLGPEFTVDVHTSAAPNGAISGSLRQDIMQ